MLTLEHTLWDSIFLNKVQNYACCPFSKHKNNFKTFYCFIIAQNDWHCTFMPMASANVSQFPLGMFVINSRFWMINFHVVSSWYFSLFNWDLFHPESAAKTLYLKIFRGAISTTTAMQAPPLPMDLLDLTYCLRTERGKDKCRQIQKLPKTQVPRRRRTEAVKRTQE